MCWHLKKSFTCFLLPHFWQTSIPISEAESVFMQRKICISKMQEWTAAMLGSCSHRHATTAKCALGKYLLYTNLRNHSRLALTLTITSYCFAVVSQKQPDQPKYVFIRKPDGLQRRYGLASFPASAGLWIMIPPIVSSRGGRHGSYPAPVKLHIAPDPRALSWVSNLKYRSVCSYSTTDKLGSQVIFLKSVHFSESGKS